MPLYELCILHFRNGESSPKNTSGTSQITHIIASEYMTYSFERLSLEKIVSLAHIASAMKLVS